MFIRQAGDLHSEKTIVYIHGLGESGLCFEKLVQHPKLSKFKHIVPDFPGYGKSPREVKPLSLEEHADVLKSWVDSNKLGKFILAGHSMGGVIGLIFCRKYPEMISGFINIEGNISIHDCGFSSQVARYALPEFLSKGYQAISEKIYMDGLKIEPLRDYYASFRMCDPETLYKNSLELVHFSEKEKGAEEIRALNLPATYILGSPDGTGPYSQKILKKARVDIQIIDHAGHWPFLDQLEIFVDNMILFLNNL